MSAPSAATSSSASSESEPDNKKEIKQEEKHDEDHEEDQQAKKDNSKGSKASNNDNNNSKDNKDTSKEADDRIKYGKIVYNTEFDTSYIHPEYWWRCTELPSELPYWIIPDPDDDDNGDAMLSHIIQAIGLEAPNLLLKLAPHGDPCESWDPASFDVTEDVSESSDDGDDEEIDPKFKGKLAKERLGRICKGVSIACGHAGAWMVTPRLNYGNRDYFTNFMGCYSADKTVLLGTYVLGDKFKHEDAKDLDVRAAKQKRKEFCNKLVTNASPWNVKANRKTAKPTNLDPMSFPKRAAEHHNQPDFDSEDFELLLFPARGLTHLICFQSEQAHEKFWDALGAYPTGVLVVGGEEPAVKLFKTAVDNGNPVFLFNGTGGAANALSALVVSHNRAMNQHAVPELQPVRDKRYADLVNVMADNLPDTKGILVIDFLGSDFKMDELQDQITATMSMVFEGPPELGEKENERQRLERAWEFHNKLVYNARVQSIYAEVLQTVIIVATLATVILSIVAQNLVTPNSYHPHDTTLALQSCNIIVPLVAALFITVNSRFNPMLKWAALTLAAQLMEAEIYKYRTRTDQYIAQNRRGKSKAKLPVPRQVFAQNLEQIVAEVNASEMKGGLWLNPPTPEFIRPARFRAPPQKPKKVEPPAFPRRHHEEGNDHGSPRHHEADGMESHDIALAVRGPANPSQSAQKIEEKLVSSGCCGCRKRKLHVPDSAELAQELKEVTMVEEPKRLFDCCPKAVDPDKEFKRLYHKFMDSMTAERYLSDRVQKVKEKYEEQIPYLSRWSTLLQTTVFFLGTASSVLAAYKSYIYIPILVALAGAVSTLMGFHQFEARLRQANSAVAQLNLLLLWWEGLSSIERRIGTNKTHLVMTTEATIQVEVSAWIQQTRKFAKPKEEEEKEEKSDDAKKK